MTRKQKRNLVSMCRDIKNQEEKKNDRAAREEYWEENRLANFGIFRARLVAEAQRLAYLNWYKQCKSL